MKGRTCIGEIGNGKETYNLNVVDVLPEDERIKWEGDQKVVKRVAIHKCLEALLRNSLYGYLFLKLAKMTCLSYYLLFFLFNKIGK
jgi:hypothetical protein